MRLLPGVLPGGVPAVAVRVALPSMRFSPAIVGTKKVRQLVQMPISFNIPK